MIVEGSRSAALHRFAWLTAGATLLLLLAGATVTSTGSGLSVPDWPLSYGKVFPRMEGGVLFEHSHRLIAGAVAVLIAVLCLWMWRAERRAWVRRLAYTAGALVVAQAVLGGLTVLLQLPPAISVAHAGMAIVVFTLVVVLAVVTSAAWMRAPVGVSPGAARLAPWVSWLAALVFAQVLAGAVMRHIGAGLACTDFPLCNGRLVPPLTSLYVTIHFLHRLGGVLVTLGVLALAGLTYRWARGQHGLIGLARWLSALVLVQFVLGVLSIVTRLAVPVTVLHQAAGATLFASTVLMAVWCHRLGRSSAVRVPAVHAPLAQGTAG